jgi:hypothetical protein
VNETETRMACGGVVVGVVVGVVAVVAVAAATVLVGAAVLGETQCSAFGRTELGERRLLRRLGCSAAQHPQTNLGACCQFTRKEVGSTIDRCPVDQHILDVANREVRIMGGRNEVGECRPFPIGHSVPWRECGEVVPCGLDRSGQCFGRGGHLLHATGLSLPAGVHHWPDPDRPSLSVRRISDHTVSQRIDEREFVETRCNGGPRRRTSWRDRLLAIQDVRLGGDRYGAGEPARYLCCEAPPGQSHRMRVRATWGVIR